MLWNLHWRMVYLALTQLTDGKFEESVFKVSLSQVTTLWELLFSFLCFLFPSLQIFLPHPTLYLCTHSTYTMIQWIIYIANIVSINFEPQSFNCLCWMCTRMKSKIIHPLIWMSSTVAVIEKERERAELKKFINPAKILKWATGHKDI